MMRDVFSPSAALCLALVACSLHLVAALPADGVVLAERAVPTISIAKCCKNAQEATAFSLIYGAPLANFVQFALPELQDDGSRINVPIPQLQLANSSFTNVIRPNQDTLYTSAVIDLSKDNVVLTIPKIPNDKYWDFAFYDPYGNNFANLGTVNGSEPGDYLIKSAFHTPSTDKPPGTSSVDAESGSKYKGVIRTTSVYNILLSRILVTPGDEADIQTVNGYQEKIKLATIKRHDTPKLPSLISISQKVAREGLSVTKPRDILEYLAAINPYITPEDINGVDRLEKILKQAGIGNGPLKMSNGTYNKPKGVNLETAAKVANATVIATPRRPGRVKLVNNGWALVFPNIQGNYGADYAARAAYANLGYLALIPDQEEYPIYIADTISMPVLPKNQAYLVTFSSKPPIPTSGFWSLTAYTAELYLVPNNLKRYSLGNRSNITYPDGSLVYGPGASASSDEAFQILMQAADNPPPKNWTSNWLPTFSGGGEYVPYNLRWGAPGPAFRNGSYTYPTVQTIAAIT